ncbi:MAG: DUF2459 domain-containing protein [Ignavibacteriaceae bacterium]|nr:DUF2459 domain-containing protein [Ignavibacteriaceae bacterium]
MSNLVIFPVIFFFLHTSPPLQVSEIQNDNSSYQIYLTKQYWHTAVVIKKVDIDTTIFPEVNLFDDASLIDIGWGDEEFYQHPGFDSGLAYKALFYATPSTIRVEGIRIPMQQYFDISEIVVEFTISKNQLDTLCTYISKTVWQNNNGQPDILSTQGLGRIIFFKANGEYHLFNTCNTWLARGLKHTGINITDDIILTEQLFNEAAKVGKVLKVEE